jgi:hypothetical protein
MSEILPPLNQDDAIKLGKDIDSLLSSIVAHEMKLTHSYARLGSLLCEVKRQQYWIAFGHDRFSSYLKEVGQKINRERSQMYLILTVAETLLEHLSEQELEAIGISKAHELRRFVKQSGLSPKALISPTDEMEDVIPLSEYASREDVTAAQLRVQVNKLLHSDEEPKGTWFDMGGFYILPEERQLLDQFWTIGKKVVGAEDHWSEHTWKKAVVLAAAQECIGSWINEAYGRN